MAIEIKQVNHPFYTAKVTPPHVRSGYWETNTPMELDKLVQELIKLGCHPTDIGDVLYEIDPALIREKK